VHDLQHNADAGDGALDTGGTLTGENREITATAANGYSCALKRARWTGSVTRFDDTEPRNVIRQYVQREHHRVDHSCLPLDDMSRMTTSSWWNTRCSTLFVALSSSLPVPR